MRLDSVQPVTAPVSAFASSSSGGVLVPPSEVGNDDTAEMDVTDNDSMVAERYVAVVQNPSPELSAGEEPSTAARANAAVSVVPSADDQTSPLSPLDGNWLYAPPSELAQYKAELSRVKDAFVGDDDGQMDDPTMVWEYAEDIFEYMGKLEVCVFSIQASHVSRVDASRGGTGSNNAFTELYRQTDGDHVGDARHAHRLALARPPPLSPSAGDPLDYHQHCRSLPVQA